MEELLKEGELVQYVLNDRLADTDMTDEEKLELLVFYM
jgi:hypothetical protein